MSKSFYLLLLLITVKSYTQNHIVDNGKSYIVIDEKAEIHLEPDEVLIIFDIKTFGKTAIEANYKNDNSLEKVSNLLETIKLSGLKYENKLVFLNRDITKEEQSYIAKQQINVSLKDFSKYDFLIKELRDLDVIMLPSQLISYRIKEGESEAAIKAMEIAKEKAEKYVKSLNKKIKRIVKIQEQSQYYKLHRSVITYPVKNQSEKPSIGYIAVTNKIVMTFEIK